MKVGAADRIEIERILERECIRRFLEETAKFYACRVSLRGEDGALLAGFPAAPSPGADDRAGEGPSRPGRRIAERRTIEVFGRPAGRVEVTPLDPRDRNAAVALARHVADLLSELAGKDYELDDLSREILDSYEEVNLFYDLSAALGRVRDVEGICTVILERACEIIRADRASILLLEEKTGELRVAASVGLTEEERRNVRLKVGEGISGKVVESRTARLVDDVRHLPKGMLCGYENYATRSFISVPLCVEGEKSGTAAEPADLPGGVRLPREGTRAIGVMNMTDKRSGSSFTSGDLKLLTALAHQAAILIENIRLIEVEKELKIAKEIQESLLPGAPPEVPGLDLAGACRPARNVGGDYYDILVREDTGEVITIIADVSGHNVASALMMAVARSAVRSEMKDAPDAAAAMDRVNRFLFDDLTRTELFLSMQCCIYHPGTRRLRVASAGHHPILHFPAGEKGHRLLDADGLLCGILEDGGYTERCFPLSPGDVLVLYTDGITEARDSSGRMFGLRRLAEVVGEGRSAAAGEILERVYEEVRGFAGGGAQADDMTLVVLKVAGPAGR